MSRLLSVPPAAAPSEVAAAAFAARPLRLPTLLLSLAVIALAAVAIASVLGGLLLLASLAADGRQAVWETLQQAQYDPVLRLKVGAGKISLLYIGLAAATLAAARLAGGRGWRRFVALASGRPRRSTVTGIALATLAYATVMTLTFAHPQGHRAISTGPTDPLLLAILVGNLVLLAPLAEELFFRGWLYTGLRERLGMAPSYLLTVGAFAAMHWDSGHTRALMVLPLAVALGLMREASGSIRPTMALHACYNAIIVGLTLAPLR